MSICINISERKLVLLWFLDFSKYQVSKISKVSGYFHGVLEACYEVRFLSTPCVRKSLITLSWKSYDTVEETWLGFIPSKIVSPSFSRVWSRFTYKIEFSSKIALQEFFEM